MKTLAEYTKERKVEIWWAICGAVALISGLCYGGTHILFWYGILFTCVLRYFLKSLWKIIEIDDKITELKEKESNPKP